VRGEVQAELLSGNPEKPLGDDRLDHYLQVLLAVATSRVLCLIAWYVLGGIRGMAPHQPATHRCLRTSENVSIVTSSDLRDTARIPRRNTQPS
jgi:hypothetical protein